MREPSSRNASRDGRCIVVGYDGSQTARAALDVAIERAGRGGTLVAVHAYALPDHDAETTADYDATIAKRAQYGDLLGAVAVDHREQLAGIAYDAAVIAGPAADAIVHVAEDRDADEIVIGSRGLGRLLAAAVASVSHSVIERANRPVVVIPRKSARERATT